jgi:hypothetical protein
MTSPGIDAVTVSSWETRAEKSALRIARIGKGMNADSIRLSDSQGKAPSDTGELHHPLDVVQART